MDYNKLTPKRWSQIEKEPSFSTIITEAVTKAKTHNLDQLQITVKASTNLLEVK